MFKLSFWEREKYAIIGCSIGGLLVFIFTGDAISSSIGTIASIILSFVVSFIMRLI
jgi:hypothetical protein